MAERHPAGFDRRGGGFHLRSTSQTGHGSCGRHQRLHLFGDINWRIPMNMPSAANLAPSRDSSGSAGSDAGETATWSHFKAEASGRIAGKSDLESEPTLLTSWKIHRIPVRYFGTMGKQRGRFLDSLAAVFTPPRISSKRAVVIYSHDGRWHDMERIGEDFAAAVVAVRAGNDRR